MKQRTGARRRPTRFPRHRAPRRDPCRDRGLPGASEPRQGRRRFMPDPLDENAAEDFVGDSVLVETGANRSRGVAGAGKSAARTGTVRGRRGCLKRDAAPRCFADPAGWPSADGPARASRAGRRRGRGPARPRSGERAPPVPVSAAGRGGDTSAPGDGTGGCESRIRAGGFQAASPTPLRILRPERSSSFILSPSFR